MDLFQPLQVQDDGLRRGAIETVLGLLAMLERELEREPQRNRILSVVPSMVRLSTECPFADVRAAMTNYLSHLRADLSITWAPPMPPSAFIAESMVRPRACLCGCPPALCHVSTSLFRRLSLFTLRLTPSAACSSRAFCLLGVCQTSRASSRRTRPTSRRTCRRCRRCWAPSNVCRQFASGG